MLDDSVEPRENRGLGALAEAARVTLCRFHADFCPFLFVGHSWNAFYERVNLILLVPCGGVVAPLILRGKKSEEPSTSPSTIFYLNPINSMPNCGTAVSPLVLPMVPMVGGAGVTPLIFPWKSGGNVDSLRLTGDAPASSFRLCELHGGVNLIPLNQWERVELLWLYWFCIEAKWRKSSHRTFHRLYSYICFSFEWCFLGTCKLDSADSMG